MQFVFITRPYDSHLVTVEGAAANHADALIIQRAPVTEVIAHPKD
jgi:hypothetical protein